MRFQLALPVALTLCAVHVACVQDSDGNLPVTGSVANGASAEIVSALLASNPKSIQVRRQNYGDGTRIIFSSL